jgi:hypothetical protein
MNRRIKALLVAVAAVAGLAVVVGPALAAAPTLQVSPELGSAPQGVLGQVLTATTTDAVGMQVHFEVTSGPGEPASGGGLAGDTPLQPDYRCTVAANNQCSVTVVSATTGTAAVRAWVNVDGTDAASDADNAEGRLADKSIIAGLDGTDCATEGNPGSSARTACETGIPVAGASAEPDLTDVVQIVFTAAPTKLDCDDSNPGTDTDVIASDDQETNNFQDKERYTCTAYDPGGNPVPNVRIDGENLSPAALGSVNDPDNAAADPADYFTQKDQTNNYTVTDFCVTGTTGSCSNDIPASEGQVGTAEICFWIDSDNDYGSGAAGPSFATGQGATAPDGADCGTGEPFGETEKNDVTDSVRITWDNTTPATTSTTTTVATTTTTAAPTTTTTSGGTTTTTAGGTTTTTAGGTTTTTTGGTTTTTTGATTTTTTGGTTTTTSGATTTSTSTTTSTTVPPPPNPGPPPPNVGRPVRAGAVGTNDDQLWVTRGFGTGFNPFGGKLIAAPAIGRIAQADLSAEATPVFVGTGSDNALYVRRPAENWRRLSSGPTFCKDNPGAVVYDAGGGNQVLTVACWGSDNALWTASGPISPFGTPTLNSWHSLGGTLTAGPSVGLAQGVVTFLAPGGGGRIWQSTGGTFTATPWTCIGHTAFGSLNGFAFFGCHGSDGALWVAKNAGAGWGAAFSVGGQLLNGPGVAVATESAVFFVEGTDHGVWQMTVENASNAHSGFYPNGGNVKFGIGATSL